jgi:DNA-binding XRE family transcriptional regulator
LLLRGGLIVSSAASTVVAVERADADERLRLCLKMIRSILTLLDALFFSVHNCPLPNE